MKIKNLKQSKVNKYFAFEKACIPPLLISIKKDENKKNNIFGFVR